MSTHLTANTVAIPGNSAPRGSTLLSLLFELHETTRLSAEALAQLAAEKIATREVVLTGNYAGVTTGWL